MSAISKRFIGAVLSATFLVLPACNSKDPVSKTPSAPPVDVSYPVARQVTDYELFPGRTEAVKRHDIQAQVTGILKDVTFEDGNDVKENEVLFIIDDRQYKAEHDKALANVEVARARQDKGKKDFERVVATKKEDPGAVSQKQFDLAFSEKEETKAAFDLAVAQEELAKVFLDYCQIKSKITGKIGASQLKEGNLVLKDKTLLASVVTQKPIYATFNVDETTLLRFKDMIRTGKLKTYKDQKFKVELAMSDEKTFQRTGTIDFINNELDPTTGTIKVRVLNLNEDLALTPQQYVRIKLPVGDPYQALLVTDSALGADQDQKYLWVLNDKELIEKRPVEIGQMHDGLRVIKPYREVPQIDDKGQTTLKKIAVLGPKDRVVVNGVQRVREGISVKANSVDMPVALSDQPLIRVNPAKEEKK